MAQPQQQSPQTQQVAPAGGAALDKERIYQLVLELGDPAKREQSF